jgi:general stress protein YciG
MRGALPQHMTTRSEGEAAEPIEAVDLTEDSPAAASPARGFAAMSPERQREIARRGGRAAHERGTAHEFSLDEARAAGRRGGLAVARDRDHMSRIGREGARKSAAVRKRKAPEA